MRLHLRVLNTPPGEPNFVIDPPGGLVGRSTESVVCLPYESVSRQHAELQYDGHRWWLHQRSQNSLTILDEQPLLVGNRPGQLLARGLLKLGRVELQYWQEAAAVTTVASTRPLPDAEATMILPRRLAPMAIPPAVLAQMAPVRVADSAPLAAPQTMIRRSAVAVPPPPPPEALSAKSETPMTLIIRPGTRAPLPATAPQPAPVTLPIAEHQLPDSRLSEPAPPVPPNPELAALRSERDRLATEVTRLKRENEELRATRAAPPPAPSAQTPPADVAALSEKALELLLPFGRSLEQAGEALRQGDTAQARGLLRSASFALADLRDLFQP